MPFIVLSQKHNNYHGANLFTCCGKKLATLRFHEAEEI